jgi:hypothetical protein
VRRAAHRLVLKTDRYGSPSRQRAHDGYRRREGTLVVDESTMSETPSTNTPIAMKKAAVASASGRLIARSNAPIARTSLIARIIPQKAANGGSGFSPTRARAQRGPAVWTRPRCRAARRVFIPDGFDDDLLAAYVRGLLEHFELKAASLDPYNAITLSPFLAQGVGTFRHL